MSNPTTTPLNTSDVGVNYAIRQPRTGSKRFRFQFLGTYSGVNGQMEGSMTGAAGTYTKLSCVREDTKATFNGTVGNSQFSIVGFCQGFTYVRFNPSQITSGPINVTMDDGAFDQPDGSSVLNIAVLSNTLTSASANALSVGPAGSTNPAFNVDSSAGSAATGWGVVAAAAAGGAALKVLSSGSAENGTIDAKGTGTLTLQGTATGAITLGQATGVTGALTVTSAGASAFSAGLAGASNPALQVDASTGSSATGWKVKSAAAAGGAALSVISSGTNEGGTIDAKGTGTLKLGSVGTGHVELGALCASGPAVIIPGTLTAGGLLTCALQIATSGPVIYSGSGAPSISAAVKGSLYLRTDGTSGSTRAYIASDTVGTWTAISTAA